MNEDDPQYSTSANMCLSSQMYSSSFTSNITDKVCTDQVIIITNA